MASVKSSSKHSLNKLRDFDFHDAILSKEEMTVYKATGVLQSHENYVRLLTAIQYAGLELYYKAFHDQEYGFGVPTEPDKVYKYLKTLQEDFEAMKAGGDLNESEFDVLFPASRETYTQDFGFELFHKVIKYLQIKHGSDQEENHLNFLNTIDDLQALFLDKSLVRKLQKSAGFVEDAWNELADILKKLDYNCSKVETLRYIDIDENKTFRYALIRSEVDVLLSECDDCTKTVKTSLLALDRLKGNFEIALSESKENNNNEKQKMDLEGLNILRNEVIKNQNALTVQREELNTLIPMIKFWRQKNLEGDVIVCDEKVSRLRNDVNDQASRVGELFNTVSFDICRIKERTSSLSGDFKVVVSPSLSEQSR